MKSLSIVISTHAGLHSEEEEPSIANRADIERDSQQHVGPTGIDGRIPEQLSKGLPGASSSS